jgi:hypothetical protein
MRAKDLSNALETQPVCNSPFAINDSMKGTHDAYQA